MKFNIGDKVILKKGSPHRWTYRASTGQIIKASDYYE